MGFLHTENKRENEQRSPRGRNVRRRRILGQTGRLTSSDEKVKVSCHFDLSDLVSDMHDRTGAVDFLDNFVLSHYVVL